MKTLFALIFLALVATASAVQVEVMTNKFTLFVDPNGNNATARKGYFDRAWRDPRSAVLNASAGDTIVVFPGTYTTNNLLKAGVNYYAYPGANIVYSEPSTTAPGWGIFDDRPVGPTTNQITWLGNIFYSGGTNGTVSGTYSGCDGSLGAVVMTNANTKWYGQFGNIYCSVFVTLGGAGNVSMEYGQATLTFNNLFDWMGSPTLSGGVASPVHSGIFWGNSGKFNVTVVGDVVIHSTSSGYGFWGNSSVANAISDMNLTVGGVMLGKIYMSAVSQNYRGWMKMYEVIDCGTVANVVDYFGSGKFYLEAQKLTATNINAACFNVSSPVNLTAWTKVMKMTIDNQATKWINIQNAGNITNFFDVQQGEDLTATAKTGISLNGGTNYINGGQWLIRGTGSDVLNFAAGECVVKNATLDTSAVNNAGNNPIVLAANGLHIKGCTLIAPALADSITGNFNIGVYWSAATKDKNAGTTLLPSGGFTVDAGVR